MESDERDVNANAQKQCAKIIKRRRLSRWDSVDDSHSHRLVSSESANNIAGNQMSHSSGAHAAGNREQIDNVRTTTAAVIQSTNGINVDQITETVIPKAIDLIFRTPQRISQEMRIVTDLKQFLEEHKFNLKVMPFGSATYGYGGASTDFNICLLNKEGS